MNISVLRIGHRLVRDDRVTTHAALVARAFGADMIYMTGIPEVGRQVQGRDHTGLEKSCKSLEKGRGQSGSPYNVWHQYRRYSRKAAQRKQDTGNNWCRESPPRSVRPCRLQYCDRQPASL